MGTRHSRRYILQSDDNRKFRFSWDTLLEAGVLKESYLGHNTLAYSARNGTKSVTEVLLNHKPPPIQHYTVRDLKGLHNADDSKPEYQYFPVQGFNLVYMVIPECYIQLRDNHYTPERKRPFAGCMFYSALSKVLVQVAWSGFHLERDKLRSKESRHKSDDDWNLQSNFQDLGWFQTKGRDRIVLPGMKLSEFVILKLLLSEKLPPKLVLTNVKIDLYQCLTTHNRSDRPDVDRSRVHTIHNGIYEELLHFETPASAKDYGGILSTPEALVNCSLPRVPPTYTSGSCTRTYSLRISLDVQEASRRRKLTTMLDFEVAVEFCDEAEPMQCPPSYSFESPTELVSEETDVSWRSVCLLLGIKLLPIRGYIIGTIVYDEMCKSLYDPQEVFDRVLKRPFLRDCHLVWEGFEVISLVTDDTVVTITTIMWDILPFAWNHCYIDIVSKFKAIVMRDSLNQLPSVCLRDDIVIVPRIVGPGDAVISTEPRHDCLTAGLFLLRKSKLYRVTDEFYRLYSERHLHLDTVFPTSECRETRFEQYRLDIRFIEPTSFLQNKGEFYITPGMPISSFMELSIVINHIWAAMEEVSIILLETWIEDHYTIYYKDSLVASDTSTATYSVDIIKGNYLLHDQENSKYCFAIYPIPCDLLGSRIPQLEHSFFSENLDRHYNLSFRIELIRNGKREILHASHAILVALDERDYLGLTSKGRSISPSWRF